MEQADGFGSGYNRQMVEEVSDNQYDVQRPNSGALDISRFLSTQVDDPWPPIEGTASELQNSQFDNLASQMTSQFFNPGPFRGEQPGAEYEDEQ
jgi:hypothetical protein